MVRPEAVRLGQRIVNYALLLGSVFWLVLPPPLHWGTSAAAWAGSIVGAVRMMHGLSWSGPRAALLIVLLVVPVVNLAVLATLNRSATRVLRARGFRVGLLGAGPRDLPPPLGLPWEEDAVAAEQLISAKRS